MTWDPRTSQGNEQDKIAAFVVPYLQGRALDLGCGVRKVWPSLIGVDNGKTFGARTAADVNCEIDDLSLFADGSVDAVFSSHALEDFPVDRVPAVLAEWARVIRIGGYLVLYVPSANLYPKCGDDGANAAHKWDIYPGDIERLLRAMIADSEAPVGMPGGASHTRIHPAFGWELVESEERGEGNEYSLLVVVRKTEAGWRENVWQRNPDGRKRALVVRYGGIGDMIMMSSILPGIKAQGYHITVNCKTETDETVRHDPNIDEWIIQAQDFVPNHMLGPYWDTLRSRYDLVVNLCESIEGGLLALGERLQSTYPKAALHKMMNVNYLERTHDIAGVPHDYAPRFYPTEMESAWAKAARSRVNGPAVLWAINGSSPHKIWPWTHIVAAWLVKQTPAHLFLVADGGAGKLLQDAVIETLREDGADTSRIHGMAGKWTIRQTLAAAQVVDCVVGPETGVLNAVSFDDVAKVIYLSHSSHENLTRDWRNTTVLAPLHDTVACYPCHMLHHTWQNCHKDEATGAAACASAIAPERVFEAIALSLGARKAA